MITWHTYVNENAYNTIRYNLLYWVEENGQPSRTPYIDTKNNPTMGIGFNLRVPGNMDNILTEMGFDVSAAGTEGQYITDLRNAVNACNLNQLNTTMNQWANDTTVTTHNGKNKRSTFFLDYDEINNVFNAIAPDYELLIDKWIVKYGLAVERYSRERAVFFSLAYNSQDKNKDGIPDLLGDNLGKAIKYGNRAEAWFEIRYGSNGDNLPGIAKRRYYESDLFGLYNKTGSVDEDEAKTIMRMYTLHKNTIDAYDKTYGAQVAKANSDYQVTWVKTLENNLKDAKTFLIDKFANEQSIDNVFVGKGLSSYEYKDKGDYNDPKLVGTDKNDLMFGEKGNDTLDGDTGTDVMIGGVGDDTYKVNDSADVIEEKDGEGKELVESTADNYTLPDYVEDLTLMGKDNIDGTGNELDNDITGNTGNNKLDGGAGNDYLTGGGGNNDLSGGAGNDMLYGGADVVDFLWGEADNDTLYGGTGENNNLSGGAGDDLLYGKGSRDFLYGDAGNDIIYGGLGNNYIEGGADNDTIYGGAKDDYIDGGGGDDVLYSGRGNNDIFVDSSGVDRYHIDGRSATITDTGGDGQVFSLGGQLRGGKRLKGKTGIYSDDWGNYYEWQGDGSLLTITCVTGSIIYINNFSNDNLQIHLEEEEKTDAYAELVAIATITPSPILLDLDGDGIETTNINTGTFFDHDGNGFAELTGWVSADDGLLVMDRDKNGTIDSSQAHFFIDKRFASCIIKPTIPTRLSLYL